MCMDNGKKETPLVVSKGIVTFLQKCRQSSEIRSLCLLKLSCKLLQNFCHNLGIRKSAHFLNQNEKRKKPFGFLFLQA